MIDYSKIDLSEVRRSREILTRKLERIALETFETFKSEGLTFHQAEIVLKQVEEIMHTKTFLR